jgi:hypothetical protein
MFKRHNENAKHILCIKECEKLDAAIANDLIPEVKTWANKQNG